MGAWVWLRTGPGDLTRPVYPRNSPSTTGQNSDLLERFDLLHTVVTPQDWRPLTRSDDVVTIRTVPSVNEPTTTRGHWGRDRPPSKPRSGDHVLVGDTSLVPFVRVVLDSVVYNWDHQHVNGGNEI